MRLDELLMSARRATPAAVAIAAALVFGSLAASPAGAQKFPEFPDARLKQGRTVWLGTCEACHANDVAGAPLVHQQGGVGAAAREGEGSALQERFGWTDRSQGHADAAARRQREAHR
jgi:cytochrome c5